MTVAATTRSRKARDRDRAEPPAAEVRAIRNASISSRGALASRRPQALGAFIRCRECDRER